MDLHSSRAARAASGIARAFAGIALAATLAVSAHAQTPSQPAGSTEQKPEPVRQTVFLTNATEQRELNDIQTDLRNVFPRMKIYGVSSQLAITLVGTPDEVDAAQKMIAELDRPRKTYRITYTLTELENGSHAGAQKYVLIAASGEQSSLVAGTKVPIFTAAPDKPGAPAQIQYIDLGLKIRATPQSSANGLRLATSVERSSVAGEKPLVGAQDPTINQTTFNATANLIEGTPQALGSLDVPGTTKRLEIAVVAEAVK
jgi:type II secretory pathway component GspD/PulD (secretin)